MRVEIDKLYRGRNWEYSKQAERTLLVWVCQKLNIDCTSIRLTEGYCPEYDAEVGNILSEIKFSSKQKLNVEYAWANGEPSGILLSHAKQYITVSPGYSSDGAGGWNLRGKVRIYRRLDLLREVVKDMEANRFVTFPANEHGPGSRCVVINPKQIHHVWVGDIDYELKNHKTTFIFPDL